MDNCDLWNGTTNPDGYGMLKMWDPNSKKQLGISAHRLVWMQEYGHTERWVLHRCDVRNCINIDHLYLGDHEQNMRDRSERKRSANEQKTCCPQGHPYSSQNTMYFGPEKRWRKCRICNREASRRAWRKEAEVAQ